MRLVAITPNAEQLVVYCARVSNPANQGNHATGRRLLRYLIEHAHWSPFEMVHATLEITTSRAIARQILRHRSFAFQEFSQRYATVASDVTAIELRAQGAARQGSDGDAPMARDDLAQRVADHMRATQALYADLLAAGVAYESARMVLPEATQTTMYMAGSLRSWIHYLQLRCAASTQLEHRRVAIACRAVLAAELPVIAEALDWEAR
jgi:thymidylate synthase (FAD)